TWLHAASFVEEIGTSLSLPWGGVLIVEATKLLYRPVGAHRALAYATPRRQTVLVPGPAGISPALRLAP
ncbi:MAG: methyltransferase type 11, partial [Methylocella sp.]